MCGLSLVESWAPSADRVRLVAGCQVSSRCAIPESVGAYRCCECRCDSPDGLFEEPAGLDARMWYERAPTAASERDVDRCRRGSGGRTATV